MKINKLKILSIAICCLVTALWSEPQCMEEDEKAIQNVFFRSSVLGLSSKNLTDDQVCTLASHIKNSPHITQIELNHNFFGDLGIKSLASVLPTIPHLTNLSIYGSHVTDSGFSDLFNAVEKSPGILFLDLRGTLISNTGIIMLSDLCIKRPKLTFHCSFNNVDLSKLLAKKDSETTK
jgi:hypothetical protein